MSWFSNTVNIDEQVARATSESIPFGETDLVTSLEICDMIRSKKVPANDAMKSLKKRLISNKNPNVQMSTLHLIDTCIKNGGNHFLIAIASREFIDVLVIIVKNSQTHPEVKILILDLIQTWALTFKDQVQLKYVVTVYEKLKKDRQFTFPQPQSNITTSFIDSLTPPEWVDADNCMQCGNQFSFINRKHHCRSCGGVFCQSCSNNEIPIPALGFTDPVRVFDECFAKCSGKLYQPKAARPYVKTKAVTFVDVDEDADFKRALQLSLEDQGIKSNIPAPSKPRVSISKPVQPSPEEEDEDLKAAIAASLQDMEDQKLRETQQAERQREDNENYGDAPSNSNTNTPEGLTFKEEENVYLFSTLVNRMKEAPPGSIIHDAKLQELYSNLTTVRPKLTKSLADSISKYDLLVDMHSKIGTISRYYDQMLEAKLSRAYGRHNIQPQAPGQSPYSNYPQASAPALQSYHTGGSRNSSVAYPNNIYSQSQPELPPAPHTQTKPDYHQQPPVSQVVTQSENSPYYSYPLQSAPTTSQKPQPLQTHSQGPSAPYESESYYNYQQEPNSSHQQLQPTQTGNSQPSQPEYDYYTPGVLSTEAYNSTTTTNVPLEAQREEPIQSHLNSPPISRKLSIPDSYPPESQISYNAPSAPNNNNIPDHNSYSAPYAPPSSLSQPQYSHQYQQGNGLPKMPSPPTEMPKVQKSCNSEPLLIEL